MDPKIRCWFLRSALEVLERSNEGAHSERIYSALPKRLTPLLSPERLRSAGALDTLPLADAEDALFAIDAVVAHGAGSSMEAVGEQMLTRALADGSASVSAGDLGSTMMRLRPLFESPFVDAEVSFELSRLGPGFTLTLGLRGRPRAARLLRHYAIGTIRAAARHLASSLPGELRIASESRVDEALISVQLRNADSEQAPSSRPSSRPTRGGPSLEREVERILHGRELTTSGVMQIGKSSATPPAPRARSRGR